MRPVPASLVLLLALGACAPVGQREFVGRVYDGATGGRVTAYAIWIEHSTEVVLGDVDERGRYHVPAIPEDRDFTIGIDADGYRPFLSHNPAFATDDPLILESRYYDAYLFPSDLPSPAVSFLISLSGSQDPAAGRIRFRPTTPSALAATAAEQPAGVVGQLWSNDEDLQVATVAAEFADGQIAFAEADVTKELGTDAPGDGDALSTIETLAKGLVAEGKAKNIHQAMAAVAADRPDLYADYVGGKG